MKGSLLYISFFGGTLAACFGLQTLRLHAAAGKSVKSESNFFSSVARLQAATRDSPRVLLLGSSMTGRLPDRSRGFAGTANMGCDGGSAVETLRAIDHGDLPSAPFLIIEANTLQHGANLKDESVVSVVKTWHFRAGSSFPNLGAAGRPSALIYSTLMERKLGGAEGEGIEPLRVSTSPSVPSAAPGVPFSEREEQFLEELTSIALRLKARGSQMAVVFLPPGEEPGSTPQRLASEFARRAGIPFWDMAAGVEKGAVQYSDPIHMAPASAAAAMKTIMQVLQP